MDIARTLGVFATGVLLGALFFCGLWWTIRVGLTSPRAPLWFPCSALLRTSGILAGFYYVSQHVAGQTLTNLLVCLGGFLIARVAAARLAPGARGTGHAL